MRDDNYTLDVARKAAPALSDRVELEAANAASPLAGRDDDAAPACIQHH